MSYICCGILPNIKEIISREECEELSRKVLTQFSAKAT